MEVFVNGKVQSIAGNEINLLDLFNQNNVKQPDMVSVQLNGSFVNREEYGSTIVKVGDEVEFLYFMGGGKGQI
ncbi:MAG TPA: sulfur carrier protein ThiS [Bacteroidales bacterium]|jgi:sulfur carrier protein|nr:sulfur carrier protein ThiS [Bacteroidales bacterium]